MAIDSKRIAKNTFFLYVRLVLVYGVTLYTSRVVLDKLGIDDYGLYNVIYSVIGLLSFLNGTLSIGTSRFITFNLGLNNIEKLKRTFSTTLCTHLLLALFIFILGETIGIWYVNNVMVCAEERFHAAFIVYQISILTTIVSIVMVPFISEVMAHEEMEVFAYIGIFEAVAKLLVVFLLIISPFDKFIFYASLIAMVTVVVLFIYVIFCLKTYVEVSFRISFNIITFREILTFSGWNIMATLSNTLMKQGIIMLFNLFFLPVVVAAQAISNQISQATNQFVNNVRQAVNPQVIKLYAEGNFEDSKKLTFVSAEYILDLLLLLTVPCIIAMPTLLDLWLVDVPDYAVAFTQLVLLQDVLDNFNNAFYTPMVAANKIQKNSIAAVLFCLSQFVLLYFLFKLGCGPLWARYLAILSSVLFSFVVKPYILWKDVDYKPKEIMICILRCLRQMMVVSFSCFAIYYLLPQTSFIYCVSAMVSSALVVIICSLISMNAVMRAKLLRYVKYKLSLVK